MVVLEYTLLYCSYGPPYTYNLVKKWFALEFCIVKNFPVFFLTGQYYIVYRIHESSVQLDRVSTLSCLFFSIFDGTWSYCVLSPREPVFVSEFTKPFTIFCGNEINI